MKRLALCIAFVGVFAVIATSSVSAQGTPTATPVINSTPNAGTGIRNTRYCEVLPVALKDGKLVASVYNTLGHNDCPADAWKAMDVNAIKKQFKAVDVVLNGPRYWMMDKVVGKGDTAKGEVVTIGGIEFTKRAEVVIKLTEMKSTPYQERNVERETQYTFDAGKPVYEIVSADGNTYVMQTYSQQVDPDLTADKLASLGDRLNLPKGWSFKEVTPETDLVLSANGVAHLIQDDLGNSYQRMESTDLSATGASVPEATVTATPN